MERVQLPGLGGDHPCKMSWRFYHCIAGWDPGGASLDTLAWLLQNAAGAADLGLLQVKGTSAPITLCFLEFQHVVVVPTLLLACF